MDSNKSNTTVMDEASPMWRPSPSPEESWSDASGANENEEWPVKAVVGEESRLDGTLRYEVRWENWHRKDGSNTTWQADSFSKAVLGPWKRTQQRIRTTIAEVSLDMKVPWPDDAIHRRITEHRQQAYEEKLAKRYRMGPRRTTDWDAEIESAYRKLQEPERGESSSKLRVRRGNQASTPGPSAGTSARSPSLHRSKRSSPPLNVSSRDKSVTIGPPSRRGRGRPRIDSPPVSSPVSATATPSTLSRRGKMSLTPSSAGSSKEADLMRTRLPSVIISQPTVRGRISSAWNKAAKEAGAAMVRISPDISDEEIPRNLRKFRYMEKGYVFSDDELKEIFDAPRGVFTGCDCMTCSNNSTCSCRDLTSIYDLGDGTHVSAYFEGLFTFRTPRGVDVIECNKYCGCDNECENRVVQRPRDISLEIFDTKRCGWGVRALGDIPQGKVIGTYAGMLIRRDEVNELPDEHQGYLFDLDSTEVLDSENLGGKYTVDCYECGNWTRFVNHSCSPNMQVFCVVYDTIPYVNMPYVAYVASIDIPAGTELTLDYHPYAEETKKRKRPEKGRECQCGAVVCRGWFYKT